MRLNLPVIPDKNDPDPLVIYHGPTCSDGFSAALAAWLFYEGRAEFLPLEHGDRCDIDDLPDLTGRAVYILDFSFAEPVLRAIDQRVAKLVLLDHHKSAADKLCGFASRTGVVHFDLKKSGARLAWEFFHPDQAAPDLVRYVEDRDIWVWQYPQTAGFLAALDMEPFDFARWHAITQFDATQASAYISRGEAMDAKFRKLALQIADNAQSLRFNGVDGLMVNAPGVFHSLVGDILSHKSGTYALLWSVDQKGAVKCGLRSKVNFNCIGLAESMGGGGHAQACGFRMPYQRLAELLGGSLSGLRTPSRPI